jgi:hypothetical protein
MTHGRKHPQARRVGQFGGYASGLSDGVSRPAQRCERMFALTRTTKGHESPSLWRLSILAAVCFLGCDNCDRGKRTRDAGMCAPCVHSADCETGLSCVNGVCETAPPSCHVKIGL